MARIRSVHPGLWTDDAFMGLSPHARLLFIGLLTECDDQGVFQWKPLTLKARLLPADNVDVPLLLSELAIDGLILTFHSNAIQYGAVRNFCRWQRPKKPNYVHPITDKVRTYVGLTHDSSELEPDEGEPVPHKEGTNGEAVPHQFPTSGENPPQMEDGGGMSKREKKESMPRKRGTRLPDDWVPAQSVREFSHELMLHWPSVLAKFRDYWAAQPGQKGVKLDWDATFRNWCRNEAERRPPRNPPMTGTF